MYSLPGGDIWMIYQSVYKVCLILCGSLQTSRKQSYSKCINFTETNCMDQPDGWLLWARSPTHLFSPHLPTSTLSPCSTSPCVVAVSWLHLPPRRKESTSHHPAAPENPGLREQPIRKASPSFLFYIQDTNILHSVHCPWQYIISSSLLFHMQTFFPVSIVHGTTMPGEYRTTAQSTV